MFFTSFRLPSPRFFASVIAAALLTTPTSATAEHAQKNNGLTVTLAKQQLELRYPTPVRLDQILLDSQKQLSDTPYYLGAKLVSDEQQAKVDKLYQDVLTQLDTLASPQAQSIKQQLEQFNYVGREWLDLDYDRIRLKHNLNPQLSGQYQLWLASPKHQIWLLGLVNEPKQQPLQANQDIDVYLEAATPLEDGDITHPFVIQPDGKVTNPHISYWQPQRVYLAPEAIVFIGFKDQPQLNQAIVALLRNAVEKK